MGISCTKRIYQVFVSSNHDEQRAGGNTSSPVTEVTLGIPLSFKARRLSEEKKKKKEIVDDLLVMCIKDVAKRISNFNPELFDVIPVDLVQRIFDELIENYTVDTPTLSLFDSKCIDKADLFTQPAVSDYWLECLCSEFLRVLHVSHSKM